MAVDTDREDDDISALRATRLAEEQERAAWFDEAGERTEYICAQIADARLLVRTEDKHIGRQLFAKKGRGDIKVLRRCVAAAQAVGGDTAAVGDTLIDVGANIGSTVIPALLTLPFARAVAIEPEPENFTTLRINLILNDVEERTTAMQAAVSNAVGELALMVNRARSGKHWIATGDDMVAHADETPITVPTVTLDSIAGSAFDPDDVGLLWIDAENHEGQILEGASELLRRGVPAVFEWDRKGLDDRGDLGKIVAAISEHYTHFADMRANYDRGRPKYALLPVDELGAYTRMGTKGEHFTDVLVLRAETPQGRERRPRRDHARPRRMSELSTRAGWSALDERRSASVGRNHRRRVVVEGVSKRYARLRPRLLTRRTSSDLRLALRPPVDRLGRRRDDRRRPRR